MENSGVLLNVEDETSLRVLEDWGFRLHSFERRGSGYPPGVFQSASELCRCIRNLGMESSVRRLRISDVGHPE